MRLFSGDISVAAANASLWVGNRCALSIYGTEYTDQCPFRNGNGYGDGRAVSVFEGCFEGRWEMRLRAAAERHTVVAAMGAPCCDPATRVSAQELMHAGVLDLAR